MSPSRAHALAVHALLRAALPAGTDVFYGQVTRADAELSWPYLVVWPPPADRPQDSLDGRSGGRLDTVVQVTGAGTTVDEVLDVLDRAADALEGVAPTIAGRTCQRLWFDEQAPPPPVEDPQVRTPGGRSILTSFLTVRLTSVAG